MKLEKLGKVYMIVSPSGKIYIGSTTMDLKKRWYSYYKLNCYTQRRLYYSLKKYGPKKHIFVKLWEGSITEMLKMEAFFGEKYNVLDVKAGLNCKLPKISDTYNCISDDTRKRIGLSKTGIKQSDETKLKKSIANKGQIISIEQRLKISQANTGRVMTLEQRQKLSKSKKGKTLSLKHRENIGISGRKPIIQYDLNMNFIKEWKSSLEASLELNINIECIRLCCQTRRKMYKNFIWKYKINK
jgi:group I intron endonuclease